MAIPLENKLTAELVTLHFHSRGNFMSLDFHTGVSLELLNSTFIQLIEHPDFQFNMNACYNFSNAYPELHMSEIEEHAHFVAENLYIRGRSYRLALVANDPLNTALLSVYKLLISKSAIDAEIFSKKINAIKWLLNLFETE